MSQTGFVFDEQFLRHDTGPGHPERPERLQAILDSLRQSRLWDDLQHHAPREAEAEWIEAVHDKDHADRVARSGLHGSQLLDASDTVVSPGSHRAALLAVGGVLDAVDRVADGRWGRAFVCARPPGHHAEAGAAMGFCLFNQIAIGARYAQRRAGFEKIAVVDFDVHHGNGTQHAFERDPTVFYASLHQWPWYPGTGNATERGIGEGESTTLNCPLEAGTGDREWLAALEQPVLPALEEFRPDFLLVSAGFDAHRLDPLSGTEVTEEGYRTMAERLRELAERHCGGRLVAVLEGGYDLDSLASSTQAFLGSLDA